MGKIQVPQQYRNQENGYLFHLLDVHYAALLRGLRVRIQQRERAIPKSFQRCQRDFCAANVHEETEPDPQRKAIIYQWI